MSLSNQRMYTGTKNKMLDFFTIAWDRCSKFFHEIDSKWNCLCNTNRAKQVGCLSNIFRNLYCPHQNRFQTLWVHRAAGVCMCLSTGLVHRIDVLPVFQIQRNGNWKSVRARDRSHLVGRREMCWQRDIDSWLSSQRMDESQLSTQWGRICVVWHVTCTVR